MLRFLIVIVICTSVLSCHSKELVKPGKKFIGAWEWVNTSGGIQGRVETSQSTGNDLSVLFGANNVYKKYLNNKVIDEQSFVVSTEKCIHDGTIKDLITFSSGEKWMIESVDAGNLVISDEAHDGFTSVYKKQPAID